MENGPVVSGDAAIVGDLTIGHLKTVKQTVATFNLKTNAAVRACCGCLDDQEGRAFLVADLRGVELIRNSGEEGNSRRNEPRTLGEEIDEKIAAHEAALDKLGAAARQKKSRARKGEGADEKIAAIDAKLQSDKAALAAAVVVLERLPDTKVKIQTKRERPPKPAPVPEPQPSTAAALAAAVTEARVELKHAELQVLELTCGCRRLENTIKRHGEPAFPSVLVKRMPDGADYVLWEEERAEIKSQWEEEWRTYKAECTLLEDLKRELYDARRDEEDAKLHVAMAEADQARHLLELQRAREHAEQQEAMCDLRIRVMELEREKAEAAERAANAPMRERMRAAAVEVWGPDHAARPPTAVYDLR